VLKRLREDDGPVVRTRGSHRQLQHPTKRGRWQVAWPRPWAAMPVSGHPGDDVDPKTLKSVWRQAQWEGAR